MSLAIQLPKRILPDVKYQFVLFNIFSVLFGHLGVILPLIVLILQGDYPKIHKTFIAEGALLLTTIPLASTSLYNILFNISYSEERRFRAIKLIFIGFLLLGILFSAIIYSSTISSISTGLLHSILHIAFYVVGLILVYYAFFVQLMDDYYESFQDYDDKLVKDMVSSASSKKSEGGISI